MQEKYMVHIIEDYYLKGYRYGVVLLKKKHKKEIEDDDDDDAIDVDGKIIYDRKDFKNMGYFNDSYSAFITLLSLITNAKANEVDTIQEYIEIQKQYVNILSARYNQIENLPQREKS